MGSEALILGLIITALCLFFIVWPFVNVTRRSVAASSGAATTLESLLEQRETVFTALRDLDFDYETGKLTDEDYHAQRETWVERGVDVLKAIDAIQQHARETVPGMEMPGRGPRDEHVTAARPGTANDFDAQIEAAIAARRRSS
jgi:hypothetical protein